MNSGPLLFLGLFFTLASSFWGLVLLPQIYIGRQQPVVIASTGALYPTPRAGQARQGAEVYRSLGCVECHSQQVRQSGVEFEVWLAEAGTNKAVLAATLTGLGLTAAEAGRATEQSSPTRVLAGLSAVQAQQIARRLTNGGAKGEAALVTLGPDIRRGWGKRTSVAQDYLYDNPVLLGHQRVGPDLANYGARANVATNILLHLYRPQSIWPESMMPAYPFLFTKRQLKHGEKVPEATILVVNKTALNPGQAIVPTPDAHALVAYLTSLQIEASLFEAPVPQPVTVQRFTNTTAVATNAAMTPSNSPAPAK